MRPLIEMDTIQIEFTNACPHRCSNCTRLVGHHREPFMLSWKQFTAAVDSMEGFPKMVGAMGGEPLLHPKFEAMCDYMRSKFPPSQLGLWTCLPEGFEHYREVICRTFGHIFLNDHTRSDVLHTPILVTADEIVGNGSMEKWQMEYVQHHCWVQNSWSASINPKGAFFCEIAAALAQLLNYDDLGWRVKPGWWKKMPIDYVLQQGALCHLCGAALPLQKRESTDGRDDISNYWVKCLTHLKSPKLAKGAAGWVPHDLQTHEDPRPTATYKDPDYRDKIAARYGMFIMPNSQGFTTPYLKSNWTKEKEKSNGESVQGQGERPGESDQQNLDAGENPIRSRCEKVHTAHWQGKVTRPSW